MNILPQRRTKYDTKVHKVKIQNIKTLCTFVNSFIFLCFVKIVVIQYFTCLNSNKKSMLKSVSLKLIQNNTIELYRNNLTTEFKKSLTRSFTEFCFNSLKLITNSIFTSPELSGQLVVKYKKSQSEMNRLFRNSYYESS